MREEVHRNRHTALAELLHGRRLYERSNVREHGKVLVVEQRLHRPETRMECKGGSLCLKA